MGKKCQFMTNDFIIDNDYRGEYPFIYYGYFNRKFENGDRFFSSVSSDSIDKDGGNNLDTLEGRMNFTASYLSSDGVYIIECSDKKFSNKDLSGNIKILFYDNETLSKSDMSVGLIYDISGDSYHTTSAFVRGKRRSWGTGVSEFVNIEKKIARSCDYYMVPKPAIEVSYEVEDVLREAMMLTCGILKDGKKHIDDLVSPLSFNDEKTASNDPSTVIVNKNKILSGLMGIYARCVAAGKSKKL